MRPNQPPPRVAVAVRAPRGRARPAAALVRSEAIGSSSVQADHAPRPAGGKLVSRERQGPDPAMRALFDRSAGGFGQLVSAVPDVSPSSLAGRNRRCWRPVLRGSTWPDPTSRFAQPAAPRRAPLGGPHQNVEAKPVVKLSSGWPRSYARAGRGRSAAKGAQIDLCTRPRLGCRCGACVPTWARSVRYGTGDRKR